MGESKNNNSQIYKKWWFWVIVVVIAFVAIGIAGGAKKDGTTNNPQGTNTSSQAKNIYSAGENFEFDGLTLNVSPTYTLSVINNQFSDYNGKTVVALPITVTNNKNEASTLNMFSYKVYGAGGVELDKPSAYFMDDSVDYGGNLQPGSSYTKNLYFVYDGNGEYKIEFGYGKTEASVILNINQ